MRLQAFIVQYFKKNIPVDSKYKADKEKLSKDKKD